MAIHQYISDKYMPSLLGRTIEERATVDMLQGIIWDLKKTATMGCYTDGDRQKLTLQTLIKIESLANYIQPTKKYLTGNNLTYLDFYLYELLCLIDFTSDGKVFKEYPDLAEYQFRISQLKNLKEYLVSSKCLTAPFNMKFARINNWPPQTPPITDK